jgi:hypothetical protein
MQNSAVLLAALAEMLGYLALCLRHIILNAAL